MPHLPWDGFLVFVSSVQFSRSADIFIAVICRARASCRPAGIRQYNLPALPRPFLHLTGTKNVIF